MPAVLRPSGVRDTARRVLIVDDDADTRELLGVVLSRRGYAVQLAASAGAALELASAFAPEVVLTDIGLPDVNGFELAESLRQLPALKACRLVAVTGHTGPEVQQRVKLAGFAGYLLKPVTLDAVIAAVEGFETASAAG